MNIDIRLSLGFFEHPKTLKLQKRCGVEAVLCLQRLWLWAAGNRPNGVLSGMDEEDIEIVAKWTGDDGKFIRALEELHWIDWNHDPACEADGCWVLHGWEEHQAYASKSEERHERAKKAAQAKWERWQAKHEQKASNAQDMLDDANSNAKPMLNSASSRNEQAFSNAPRHQDTKTPSIIKDNIPPTPQRGDEVRGKKETIADILQEQPQELAEPLMEFVRHRRNLKKPLTPHALRLQISNLQKLASGNLDRQKFLIEHAIMNGWQGIYEPKEDVSHVPRPTTVGQQRQQERQVMARMLLEDGDRRRAEEMRDDHGNRVVTQPDGTQLTLPPGW